MAIRSDLARLATALDSVLPAVYCTFLLNYPQYLLDRPSISELYLLHSVDQLIFHNLVCRTIQGPRWIHIDAR